MASFLVAYGTGEGQTANVAAYIQEILRGRGHEVETVNLGDDPEPTVESFDAVFVGSSVHNRRHRPEVVEFVERNQEALETRQSAFFQLSLASSLPFDWARRGASDFVDTLVDQTGWRPDRIGRFAGAVAYTKYTRIERLLFKFVSAVTTGDTDTSRDYEYTDWNEVEAFAAEFASDVEALSRAEETPTARITPSKIRPHLATGVALVVGVLGLVVGMLGLVYGLSVRWTFHRDC
ncbi:MAG: flavodoxin domain-containing protein [Halobacteriota archaeon]